MIKTIENSVSVLLQSILFVYAVNLCLNVKYRINKSLMIPVILFIFSTTTLLNIILVSMPLKILIVHIFVLFILSLLYRKDIKTALIAFGLIIIILGINMIIYINLSTLFTRLITSYTLKSKTIVPFIFNCLVFILIIYMKNLFIKLTHSINIIKYPASIILIAIFTLDFMFSYYLLNYTNDDYISKNIIIGSAFIFFIISFIYFTNLQAKSLEISELNTSLDVKITELRKMKHDFGSQISYLYGLYLMDRFEDLGSALKNIIDDTSSVHCGTTVYVTEIKNRFFESMLKDITLSGINVILNDSADLSSTKVPEYELHRIFSNIVSNAINVMNGKGLINIKTYNSLNHLTVKIENNGPMIPEKNLNKIFESGYTTKNNLTGDHGFGLSIVKDLVEKYMGSISVKSNNSSTEFKIVFPLK